jgi:(p)ppGpp synthase/HD superfamily hydrolase
MTLNRAIAIAADAYANSKPDHFGVNILQHAIRVMQAVPDDLKVPAVLHDVIEDSPLSTKDLQAFDVPERDVVLICMLTHIKDVDHQTYFEYIRRIKKSKEATIIKMADLADNMNLSRGVPQKPSLLEQYGKAMQILTEEGE